VSLRSRPQDNRDHGDGQSGQAYAAALLRAKALAEQTAKQASVKLGEIISITNSTEYTARLGKRGPATPQMMVAVEAAKLPMLELHRAIVERQASVTVTYAIAP